MSQATTWGVQSAGPATMAQYAARDNAALDALLSAHRGASRPAYAVASTIWVKAGTAPVTDAEIYYFDGTNDILIATINESTNAITFAGLEIGTDVQAYDADTLFADTSDTLTAKYTVTPITDTSSSGSITLDFSTRYKTLIELTENITSVTLTGLSDGDECVAAFRQDSTDRTVSGWTHATATLLYVGGAAPTIVSGADNVTRVHIEYRNQGGVEEIYISSVDYSN